MIKILLMLFSFSFAYSSNTFIIEQAHFNEDIFIDTVYGKWQDDFVIPLMVVWGQPSGTQTTIPDSVSGYHTTLSSSSFTIPNIDSLEFDFSFLTFNQDTISDMMILMTGYQTSGTVTDTVSSRVVIFGQNKLDSLESIDVDVSEILKFEPFVATQLTFAQHFTDEDYRDLTGKSSYVLVGSNVSIDTTIPDPKINTNIKEQLSKFKVYPNPANQFLNIESIESSAFMPYNIEFLSLTGEVLFRKDAIESKQFKLDLSAIYNGTYILIINTESSKESIPIIINK